MKAVWALVAVSWCLVMGIPLYGLLGVTLGDVDPWINAGFDDVLYALILGCCANLVLLGLMYAAFRIFVRKL